MKVGFVGWRGMVGSVLMQRMQEENDFAALEPVFFSTSQAGGTAPFNAGILQDASDIDALKELDAVVTCQGAIIPRTCIPNCASPAGTATGLMQPVPCAWIQMR